MEVGDEVVPGLPPGSSTQTPVPVPGIVVKISVNTTPKVEIPYLFEVSVFVGKFSGPKSFVIGWSPDSFPRKRSVGGVQDDIREVGDSSVDLRACDTEFDGVVGGG